MSWHLFYQPDGALKDSMIFILPIRSHRILLKAALIKKIDRTDQKRQTVASDFHKITQKPVSLFMILDIEYTVNVFHVRCNNCHKGEHYAKKCHNRQRDQQDKRKPEDWVKSTKCYSCSHRGHWQRTVQRVPWSTEKWKSQSSS